MILVCHVIWQNHVIMWLDGYESMKVSYQYTAKYGGNGLSHSGDLMVSVCHMILHDRLIKAPCDFVDRNPTR